MKKVLFILLAVVAIASGSAQAQSNVVKVNILSPIARTGSVFYERTIAEDKSLQLGVFYTGASVDDVKFRGFGITPEYRQYLSKSKEAPEGFYLAPFARYQSFTVTADDETMDVEAKGKFNSYGGGLLIGGQWLFNNRIILDTFFGPSYNKGNLKVTSGSEESLDTGFLGGFGLRTGVSIGLKF